jgi:hypothetical protein
VVGPHAAAQDPLQVLYVGNSADLGALRRLMEAHGAVTRCRLTPEVSVVIADSSVAADHPAMRTAGMLGIPVMEAAEAIAQFAGGRSRPAETRSPARRSWLFRRSTR